ncbi:MAG TPA: hypothetical protein VJ578_00580 [Dehalococcoidia bacterium]|nr:hypothetical protein [Dehalococcoidia bacterium]
MTRTLMLLVLGLVLALATLGVAYGLWSKVLTVEGTVNTGDLDAEWELAGCFELNGWPGPFSPGEYLGKDVGSVEAVIDPTDAQILHFTVNSGYPSYVADCEVEYQNSGTIPVNVVGTTIIPVAGLTNCTLTGVQSKTLTCDQLTVEFADGIGSQIDPDDGAGGSVRIHVEQLAEQESTYEFEVLICLAQWNEDPTAEECFAAAP